MNGATAGDVDRLVLLGTAGGPLPSPVRAGIAQAVVVGGRAYLVDCGSGVTRQLRRAHLLRHLDSVFITHLHSDHVCDYFSLFLLGWHILEQRAPVRVHGPAGIVPLTELQLQAYAYDIENRVRDVGRTDLRELIAPALIPVPAGASSECVAPSTEPFTVLEDERVRVTATLVAHAPVFPAFAFRFDIDGGASVVLTGDTGPHANLVTLAAGADMLVHEVYDDTSASEDDDDPAAKLREEHMRTSHTGVSDVGRIAAQAGVRRLVLTHFIPGDDVLPDSHWLSRVRDFDGEVIAGVDLMEIAL